MDLSYVISVTERGVQDRKVVCGVQGVPDLIRSDNALFGLIALVLYAQVVWEAAVAV